MIRPIVIIIFSASLLISGCSPKEPIPKEFPDKTEMAEILAKLYFAESVLSNRKYSPGSSDEGEVAPAYYKYVLEDFGLTTTEFDTIRQWYVSHPYHYQEVYEQVVLLITQREAELNKQIKAEEAAADSLPEVKDLWNSERKMVVNSLDTADRRLPFRIKVDSIERGRIRLSAFYRFLRPDRSRDGRTEMVTLFADSTSDTLSVELTKVFEKKPFSLIAPLDTMPPVIEISGYLFLHDTTATGAVEFSDISLEHQENNDNDDSEEEAEPEDAVNRDLELLKSGPDVR
ncbi:DUF4296 domain-containing protein [Marinilabilia salmonicolor]|uniref:Uncharacterized protein DUF4296 n=1 Tax=Marinilabilia salmonicolor TaxID=989 RepID=A0A368UMH3_9BACT|nr:DUF4296 domain-containing protein [Marinilabilia salmonicolor]RCW30018.1 uncharacterized protein DUF4296 [Marinilabilia salmonicolor]